MSRSRNVKSKSKSKSKSKKNKSREEKPLSRRELLRWDKKTLVKMCKKTGVPYNGSKAQMIQRIIQKSANIPTKERKKRDKWFKNLNEVNEYGFKKKSDFLITGFLSDIDPYRQIPMDLVLLFIRYTGGFLELKFDKCRPTKYYNLIKHSGTAIIRTKVGGDESYYGDRSEKILFYASKPFKLGKHAWHIKFKSKSNTKIPADQIGIFTKSTSRSQRYYYYNSGFSMGVGGNGYWISNNGKNIQYRLERENMMTRGIKCENYIPWVKNDVVSILLDCNRWNVEFRINNRLIGKRIKIEKGGYFAGVESSCNKCQYKLVY
eukprot:477788_1